MSLGLAFLLIALAVIFSVLSICFLLKGVDRTVHKTDESNSTPWKKYGIISGLFLFGAMFCFAALIAQ